MLLGVEHIYCHDKLTYGFPNTAVDSYYLLYRTLLVVAKTLESCDFHFLCRETLSSVCMY